MLSLQHAAPTVLYRSTDTVLYSSTADTLPAALYGSAADTLPLQLEVIPPPSPTSCRQGLGLGLGFGAGTAMTRQTRRRRRPFHWPACRRAVAGWLSRSLPRRGSGRTVSRQLQQNGWMRCTTRRMSELHVAATLPGGHEAPMSPLRFSSEVRARQSPRRKCRCLLPRVEVQILCLNVPDRGSSYPALLLWWRPVSMPAVTQDNADSTPGRRQ